MGLVCSVTPGRGAVPTRLPLRPRGCEGCPRPLGPAPDFSLHALGGPSAPVPTGAGSAGPLGGSGAPRGRCRAPAPPPYPAGQPSLRGRPVTLGESLALSQLRSLVCSPGSCSLLASMPPVPEFPAVSGRPGVSLGSRAPWAVSTHPGRGPDSGAPRLERGTLSASLGAEAAAGARHHRP